MYRTLAAVAIILGILIVAFASSTFFHLRQLALSTSSVNVLDHLDFSILTAGMQESSSTSVIVASDFARRLETRIYFVFGVGLILFLTGGALLLQPRQTLPKARIFHGKI